MKENLITVGGILCLFGFLTASIFIVTGIFQKIKIKNESSICAHPEKKEHNKEKKRVIS